MLEFQLVKPQKTINPSFYNESIIEDEIIRNIELISKFNEITNKTIGLKQDEEHHKGNLKEFLLDLYYPSSSYKVNNKSYKGNMGSDLVIYEKKDSDKSKVIIEVKIPNSKDMISMSMNGFIKKSFVETILYYMWEREIEKNNELTHIIITDLKNIFVFSSQDFYIFFKDKNIKNIFKKTIIEKGFDKNGTDEFYKLMMEYIPTTDTIIKYNVFNFDKLIDNRDELIDFLKTLNPIHLLKESFKNDSNSLNTNFYRELLYIIGLEENTIKGKTLITRMKKPIKGTIIESVISKIESENLYENIDNPDNVDGETYDEKLFNLSLELSITWINRILFLKLLESKLISYNNNVDENKYKFLNIETLKDYDDLNTLFFNVLNEPIKTRNPQIQSKFNLIPYLNSSLFETTELERKLIRISGLPDDDTIPVFNKTKVVNDVDGKVIKDKSLSTFEYLIKFLNTYNFGVSGNKKIVKYKKELINSSVLGLIFEKINGYKEGSFYTPGFCTNNMSKSLIENVVLDKFNKQYKWDCTSIEQLQTYLNYSKSSEYNDILDSIKICDPSVGSGHFLVSCLNQFLRIKSEMGLLLNSYSIYIEKDELYIKDRDNNLIEYKIGVDGLPSKELQKIQETLFNEKKKIIEKSLFGVDINPNSVKICRLRLWIELLKNSYYTEKSNYKELKTLPNIDINIKQGNSLIHRFPLNENLKDILKTTKISVKDYLEKVNQYKETDDKQIKKEIQKQVDDIKKNIVLELDIELNKNLQKFKGELFILEQKITQLDLLGFEIRDKELKDLNNKKKKINITSSELNHILDTQNFKNSFEWRIEFPEVLDSEGNFLGFDIIIGNPPYIKEKDGKKIFEPIRKSGVWNHIIEGKMDYWFFFLHLGFDLLKTDGRMSYITNSYWTKSTGSSKLISRIKEELTISEIINFKGYKIFDEVVGNHMIHYYINNQYDEYPTIIKEITDDFDEEKFIFNESEREYKTIFTEDNKLNFEEEHSIQYDNCDVLKNLFDVSQGLIESPDKLSKSMLDGKNNGLNVGDGVFVLSESEQVQIGFNEQEQKDLLKKYMYPYNVGKYKINYTGEKLIFSDKFLNEKDIKDGVKYPNVKNHLDRLTDFITSSNKPYSLHRPRIKKIKNGDEVIRVNIFEQEKLICKGMFDTPEFTYDDKNFYVGFSFSIIYKKEENYSLKYLLSILNSDFGKRWFHKEGKKRGIGVDIGVGVFQKFPVKKISYDEQMKFEKIVDEIISNKENDIETLVLEQTLDNMVDELYSS